MNRRVKGDAKGHKFGKGDKDGTFGLDTDKKDSVANSGRLLPSLW